MVDTLKPVRSMLIPLLGTHAVLPGATVAEIIPYHEPRQLQSMPPWLLGVLHWRGQDVPLICFEAVIGKSLPRAYPQARIAILNTLNGDPTLRFLAVLIQGIPRQLHIDSSIITAAKEKDPAHYGVLSYVFVEGAPALIPDLDYLEELVRIGLKEAAPPAEQNDKRATERSMLEL